MVWLIFQPIVSAFQLLVFLFITPTLNFINNLVFGLFKLPINIILKILFNSSLNSLLKSSSSKIIIDLIKILYQFLIVAILTGLLIGFVNSIFMVTINYVLTFKKTSFEIYDFNNLKLFIYDTFKRLINGLLVKLNIYKQNNTKQTATPSSTPTLSSLSSPTPFKNATLSNRLNMSKSELQSFLSSPSRKSPLSTSSPRKSAPVILKQINTTSSNTSSNLYNTDSSKLRERFNTFYEDDDGYDSSMRSNKAGSTITATTATTTTDSIFSSPSIAPSHTSQETYPTSISNTSSSTLNIIKEEE